MNKATLHTFMAGNRYGVLSSVSSEGTPQSALMGIAVTPELEIVFDTLKSARKYRNLISRPTCSLVIGWAGEQTVQFEGRAFELSGIELAKYHETYFEVWPDSRARLSWPGISYFVARPLWIRYTDYDQSPILIKEFSFAADEAKSTL